MISRIPCLRGSTARSLKNSPFLSKLGGFYCHTSQATSVQQQACDSFPHMEDEYADVDWDNLGFGLIRTDYMYVMKSLEDGTYKEGKISRYGNVELSPSAGVLNYGQGLFEGLKAHRNETGGLFLFRPDQNAIRMRVGAERMCMPAPSVDQFVDAVTQIAIANKRWVPPPGKGSLYIRPLLIGSGAILGLAPAPEYTFLIYASPVSNYFKEGSKPLNLYVEHEYDRASRGGTGGVKTISNYAPVLKAVTRAKSRGFSDVLYLDSVDKKYIEEVASCNIFVVKVANPSIKVFRFIEILQSRSDIHEWINPTPKPNVICQQDRVISTPTAMGTILSGITRKSVIEIACDLGYQVQERAIPVEELMQADEVFCTGTAVVVASVGSATYKGNRVEFRTDADSVCRKLCTTLVEIQTGLIEDKFGWVVEI
ncbi:hypothetical protein SAY86_015964 [Trapa natans]|uniref:Branched-chain-amino-acid transaminase n=1 Tax=Trapa natans TaxID=22666 RepID=A0AAN7QWQ3_TRANT|nr:hypothetical protein SAY86_015964 [Trapa natans]